MKLISDPEWVRPFQLDGETIQQVGWGWAVFNELRNIFNEFILLGNDFLPHSPCLEITNDGIEILLEIYPVITRKYGHFVYKNDRSFEKEKS